MCFLLSDVLLIIELQLIYFKLSLFIRFDRFAIAFPLFTSDGSGDDGVVCKFEKCVFNLMRFHSLFLSLFFVKPKDASQFKTRNNTPPRGSINFSWSIFYVPARIISCHLLFFFSWLCCLRQLFYFFFFFFFVNSKHKHTYSHTNTKPINDNYFNYLFPYQNVLDSDVYSNGICVFCTCVRMCANRNKTINEYFRCMQKTHDSHKKVNIQSHH